MYIVLVVSSHVIIKFCLRSILYFFFLDLLWLDKHCSIYIVHSLTCYDGHKIHFKFKVECFDIYISLLSSKIR